MLLKTEITGFNKLDIKKYLFTKLGEQCYQKNCPTEWPQESAPAYLSSICLILPGENNVSSLEQYSFLEASSILAFAERVMLTFPRGILHISELYPS